MTTYPSAPIDAPTADTLALMTVDPSHRTDRDVIVAAIETVAARSGGVVDPNELRAEVHGLVEPHTIGATVNALARTGRLVATGEWVITSNSTTGNNGKPARKYRLTP